MDDSRKHFERTYYLMKRIGGGQFGEAFLAIKRSIADSIHSQFWRTDENTFYKELRRRMVVVKFFKIQTRHSKFDDWEDLTTEIKFLKQNILRQSPRITELLDSYLEGMTQWFVTPYYTGGDLNHFVTNHPEAVSVAFIWHIGYQLVEAFLFLDFGISDIKNPRLPATWLKMWNWDLHSGNVLLRPARPRSEFGNLPDLAIADFGNSESASLSDIHEDEGRKRQLMDAGYITHILEPLVSMAGVTGGDPQGQLIFEWSDKFMSAYSMKNDKDSSSRLRKLFFDFAKIADHQRRKNFKPMPPTAEAGLASSVSDGELAMFASNINLAKRMTPPQISKRKWKPGSHTPSDEGRKDKKGKR